MPSASAKNSKRSRAQNTHSAEMETSLARVAKASPSCPWSGRACFSLDRLLTHRSSSQIRAEKASSHAKVSQDRVKKLEKCKRTTAARQKYYTIQRRKTSRSTNSRIIGNLERRKGIEDQMRSLCELWSSNIRTVEDVVMTGYDGRDDELAVAAANDDPHDVDMTAPMDDDEEVDEDEDSLMTDVGDAWPVTTDVEMEI
ncbi:M-phase inducer phosphatase [Purpureocillium lavendulum]|uniref:M-phase inducer phosphatase n=1 Tax=Purpureocillium lavendulum TaxID=1247861 RepID=A0AB34G3H8_9HYPO|nr:M-phase inducer phosphatase [Purpureocillium lavendulum]